MVRIEGYRCCRRGLLVPPGLTHQDPSDEAFPFEYPLVKDTSAGQQPDSCSL